jgi:plastocyanin
MNPHTRIVVVASLVATVVLLSISVGHGAAVKPVKHTVTIEAVAFQPDVVEAKRGDSIVWTNKDPFPHTVTASGKFDSKEIKPGESWTYNVQQSGDVSYICTLHPTMKATLRVK